jgi:PAS domain-containing protein
MPNKAIARQLRQSVRTTERRRASALRRLGVRSLVEAAALFPSRAGAAVSPAFGTAFAESVATAMFNPKRLVAVNDRFCDALRVPESELSGRPFHELLHPDDRDAERPRIELLFAGELPGYAGRSRMLIPGGVVHVRFTVAAVWGEGSAPRLGLAQLIEVNAAELKGHRAGKRAGSGAKIVTRHGTEGRVNGETPVYRGPHTPTTWDESRQWSGA